MDTIERELGAIAEMALGARDLREFELDWLAYLRPSVGFETACSVWTDSTGVTRHAAALGYPEATLRECFTLYMSELSPAEVAGFSADTPGIDTEVVTARRRDTLTVYRELLVPAGVSCFTTNVWHSRWGVFGFHLARCRGTAQFGKRDTDRLARVTSAVKLGQALHAADALRVVSDREWWREAWELSARECDVTRLVARGLSNPEIAKLLRVSRHTIRNQLVSVFRKAMVSSRAELVFAMSSPAALAPESERQRRARNGPWSAFLAQSARLPNL